MGLGKRTPARTALFLLILALPAGWAEAKEKLVPINNAQMHRTDQMGFRWDPDARGQISDGTSDCFDGAMLLKVNGGVFTPNKPAMQTKDGQEIVLQGAVGQISITRRIRFDLTLGAARYVEVIRNKSKNPATVRMEVYSTLGGGAGSVLTNVGRVVTNGGLEKGEVAVLAVHGGGTRPGVVFQLTTPGSSNSPVMTVQSNRNFTFTWVVSVPPGRSAAVLHTVAQRRWNGPPTPKDMAAMLKPFLHRKWTVGLPSAVRSVLVNHKGSGGESASLAAPSTADEELKAIAKAYDIERGEPSYVLIERGKPLGGAAEGTTVHVTTRLGKAEIPFEDVAVIRGGANVGRSMRVYLRDGEVLSGAVKAPGLKFKTKAGLEIPLDPAGIDALFLPKGEYDGRVGESVDAFLTLLDGTKLALGEGPDSKFEAVTPWGDLDIALSDVVRIRHRREPVPGLWLLLKDGSLLPVAVRGGKIKLVSQRFGEVAVEPGSLAAWVRNGAVARVRKSEVGEDAQPAASHVQLAGECYLTGSLVQERLTVITLAGPTPVLTEQLTRMVRGEDTEAGTPQFTFTLKDAEPISGRLRERLVSVRTSRGLCRVPVMHLFAYRNVSSKGDDEAGKKGK